MTRKEPIKLNEFLYLVSENQNVMLMFSDLSVVGTEDAISCIANSNANNSRVTGVEASDDLLKVWIEYDEDDVPLISMEGYK